MSRLLTHESPLQLLPSLAVKCGLNEAIVLQHLHERSDPDHNVDTGQGQHWIEITYEEFQEQFPFWSVRAIKRTICSLERQNLIVSRKMKESRFVRGKWYSINDEALDHLLKTLHLVQRGN